VDVSPAQVGVLARHAGAARFAFNQCLSLVKQALDARVVDGSVVVPWSGFDLINAFNQWKRSAAAGRVIAVDRAGEASVVAMGLSWRTEVLQQVFEEAAVDLGRGLAAFTASRRGERPGVPGSVSRGSNARPARWRRSGSGRRPPAGGPRSGSVTASPGR